MIIDITGTILIPGNSGRDCPGNGERKGIECCCNECDYLLCCLDSHSSSACSGCDDLCCPHSRKNKIEKTENNA